MKNQVWNSSSFIFRCVITHYKVSVSHEESRRTFRSLWLSTVTKNKTCQSVNKDYANIAHHRDQEAKPETRKHLLDHQVAHIHIVPVAFFFLEGELLHLSSIIHNLQSSPKITRTESGFPELGKQQNIAHGICPIVQRQRQSVNGTFPSSGKHRGLDNAFTGNGAASKSCVIVQLWVSNKLKC